MACSVSTSNNSVVNLLIKIPYNHLKYLYSQKLQEILIHGYHKPSRNEPKLQHLSPQKFQTPASLNIFPLLDHLIYIRIRARLIHLNPIIHMFVYLVSSTYTSGLSTCTLSWRESKSKQCSQRDQKKKSMGRNIRQPVFCQNL